MSQAARADPIAPADTDAAQQDGFGLTAETTRAAALARVGRALASAGLREAAVDARLLVTDALGIDRLALLNDGATPIGAAGAERLAVTAGRRLAREPLARIAGEAEFWGLVFGLGSATLVPRQDSESVVRAALDAIPDASHPHRILDLGTGSGCLLVALLRERPASCGLGLDREPAALAVARDNSRRLGVGDRAAFAASDWASAIEGRFDLVVSNPPYIATADIAGLDPEVTRHDPRLALDGGPDGLAAYRMILPDAPRLLAPGGHVVVEIGHDQERGVTALGREAGLGPPRPARDLGGHVRALTFESRG